MIMTTIGLTNAEVQLELFFCPFLGQENTIQESSHFITMFKVLVGI